MAPKKKKKSLFAATDKTLLSISEAAQLTEVTRQAIYVAIKLKKLKAHKNEAQWMINVQDLEEYRQSRYSRTKSMYKGELIFDSNKGLYSVNQAAKFLNVPAQKIYYATRSGKIAGSRKGCAWIIHMDEIKRYQKEYLGQKKSSNATA